MAVARLRLRKRLARAIRAGHPWIYRDALADDTPGLADGTLVVVVGANDRPLGQGFWDSTSPIAVRLLGEAGGRDPDAVIDRRLAEALERRFRSIDRQTTDAFRWIHGEADGLPGVHVDVYGRALALRHDGPGARAYYKHLPARLLELGRAAGMPIEIVVERRARRASAEGEDREGGAKALVGELPAGEIEVREHGLRFGVDLAHGQKGGLFLDQRENRALVRTLANRRRVLNLFGYTGAFSIYAAAGGARATVTVDSAAPAIAAARRNFQRNGLPLGDARFEAVDAFDFLARAAETGERFDLVISDPPSFAANRRAIEAGLAAYRRLHGLCVAVTASGGTLCAASCSSHVGREAFLTTVREGAAATRRQPIVREVRGAGPDHPVVPWFPEGDYLKFVVVDL